jgi:hypothetical protein
LPAYGYAPRLGAARAGIAVGRTPWRQLSADYWRGEARRTVSPLAPSSLPGGRQDSRSEVRLGGSRFDLQALLAHSARSERLLDTSGPDLAHVTLGGRQIGASAVWRLAPGAALTSEHRSVRHDGMQDGKRGLTTTDTKHIFAFELGPGSQLRATLNDHREQWAPTLGKPDLRKRTGTVEFKSSLDDAQRSSVRLAFTSARTEKGRQEREERVRQAQLILAPIERLRLGAEYVRKTSADGNDQATRTFTAALQPAPNTQLEAAIRALAPEHGPRTRESSLKFSTSLGGGGSRARMAGEQAVARTSDGGLKRRLNLSFTGHLGSGAAQTDLSAGLKRELREGASNSLSRTTTLHLERAFNAKLKLTADRQQKAVGSSQRPDVQTKSSCALAVKLGSQGSLSAGLELREQAQAEDGATRYFTWEQPFGVLRLKADHRVEQGVRQQASSYCALDVRARVLPDWAKDLARGHEFADAHKYLVPKNPDWLDLPFLGSRVSVKQRRGGQDDGVDTFCFAHRALLGERYHLQVAYQDRPEASKGASKGRPMVVRRQLAELAARLRSGVILSTTYTGEESSVNPADRRRTIGLGLRRRESDSEQMEVSLSRSTGRWNGEVTERNTVALLYSLRIDEEQHVRVKLGCSWGEDEPGRRAREARLDLAYAKAI